MVDKHKLREQNITLLEDAIDLLTVDKKTFELVIEEIQKIRENCANSGIYGSSIVIAVLCMMIVSAAKTKSYFGEGEKEVSAPAIAKGGGNG